MVSVSNASAITMCDTAVDAVELGSGAAQGKLVFYSGTPPANVDAALAGNTVLAELDMSNPAFGAAADAAPGAVATASAITDDTSANATGTASFARIENLSSVAVLQLTVGTSGTEIIVNTVSFVAGAVVEVTSLTVTMPEA